MTQPVAFVIHGRNEGVVRAEIEFLEDLGIVVYQVTDLAGRYGHSVSIEQLITQGIERADVIIGLLTPDEVVALYTPSTGELVKQESGWQPRPNVLFEVGVAFGIARDRVVLVTVGKVRPFSDISGILLFDLDNPSHRRNFIASVTEIVNRREKALSGDRTEVSISHPSVGRWPFFDELDDLAGRLGRIQVGHGNSKPSLLHVVRSVVNGYPEVDWKESGEYDTTAEKFMAFVVKKFGNSRYVASESFWNLVVTGFCEHVNTRKWFYGSWQATSSIARIAPRGLALIEKLRVVACLAPAIPPGGHT